MNARHLDNVISIGRVPALLPRVSRTSRTRLLHASAAESTSDIDEPSHTKREYKILGFYPEDKACLERGINFSINTRAPVQTNVTTKAVELLRAAVHHRKSVFLIGEDTFKAVASIPFVTKKWCYTTEFDPRRNGGLLEISITKPNLSDISAFQRKFSSRQVFEAPLGQIAVHIATTESSALSAEKTSGSSPNPAFPLGIGSRTAAEEYPVSRIHQRLFLHVASTVYPDLRALGLSLAKLAFEFNDENPKGQRLMDVFISIQRGHFTRQTLAETSSSYEAYPKGGEEEIRLSRSQYERSRLSSGNEDNPPGLRRAYIALGSNLGDRQSMLELACHEMDRRDVHVRRTSSLYETRPMYYHDQHSFLNGACEVETSRDPFELLDTLKEIENDLGRQKSIPNGPRSVDLDILLYDNQVIDDERLSVPHKRIMEREFVLKPLCDLIPNYSLPLPGRGPTFETQLARVAKSHSSLSPLTLLSPQLDPILARLPSRPTHIMAIMNLTPDSFSDGGLHGNAPSSLLPTLKAYLSAGVSIVDIGGQSTRPRAPQISADEEASRVLPAIKFIRSQPIFDKIAISIDTYRASVAEAAITAGANIVNDVSAGQMDQNMLPTVARLGCTIILMHMRGTPENMTTLTDYPAGTIKGVATELQERVQEAQAAGIRRWRIILDPGIGFAKNQAQNLELLRRFAELRDSPNLLGLPWAVGVSRKGFIGKITGVETPSERAWGTATTVTAAIQGGADIVRVHDVEEMVQVAKMADAIWRVSPPPPPPSDSEDM